MKSVFAIALVALTCSQASAAISDLFMPTKMNCVDSKGKRFTAAVGITRGPVFIAEGGYSVTIPLQSMGGAAVMGRPVNYTQNPNGGDLDGLIEITIYQNDDVGESGKAVEGEMTLANGPSGKITFTCDIEPERNGFRNF